MLDNLVLGDEGLSLSINGVATRFDYFWLRDNARDPVSFDSRSHQRELFTAALDPHIKPTAGQLNGNASALLLDWPDLDMAAEYDAAFLADFPARLIICACRHHAHGTGIILMLTRCGCLLPHCRAIEVSPR